MPKLRKRLPGIPADCRVAYQVMPLLSVHELLAVIESVRALLPQVRAPLLVVQSARDHTVEPESAPYRIGVSSGFGNRDTDSPSTWSGKRSLRPRRHFCGRKIGEGSRLRGCGRDFSRETICP